MSRARLYLALVAVTLVMASPHAPLSATSNDSVTRASTLALEPGDVIFRRGVGPVSAAILAAGERSDYSHVGVVVVHGGRVSVVHAVPAEAPGEFDAAKIEPLSTFLQPSRASRFVIYRLDGGRIDHAKWRATQAAAAAEVMARLAVPFDYDFDLSTPGALYCTELVLRAYARAGVDLEVTGSRLPLLHQAIVLPRDLLRSPLLRKVGP